MEFSGQNTGVGSLSFLQGTFPTQGSNPGLPHCRQILYQQSHKGSHFKTQSKEMECVWYIQRWIRWGSVLEGPSVSGGSCVCSVPQWCLALWKVNKQSRFNADVLQASSPGAWGMSQPLDYSACPSSTLIETESESEVMSDSLRPCGLCPWDFPGRSTGVGCHFLLQGIFQTQGSNPGLQVCQVGRRLPSDHQGGLCVL